MTEPLLPTRFLFRFSAPCRYRDPLWTDAGATLDESYRLLGLAELEDRATWADVRAAWSEAGIALSVEVTGKAQPTWCRDSRLDDSDGLQVWIDTRDVHNVHRASRFCHRFVFLPCAAKGGASEGGTAHKGHKSAATSVFTAVAEPVTIHRARELHNPIRQGLLQARCQLCKDGYRLTALVPAEALTGFDPVEHPRIGFTYAVLDRELGQQTFGVGSPMPYQDDPSLWPTLELVASG